MKAILAPYPPPYRGVELQAKIEFEKNRERTLFIGTSLNPKSEKNLILVKRGPFIKNGLQLFFKIWAHKKQIKEISAHYATTFGFLAFLAKKFFGIKYTVTCHGSDVLVNMDKPFYRIFNNLALRNASKVFVVSRDLGAHLIEHGYHHKNLEYRQNEIDKKIFKKLRLKKKNQILFAGGIQYSKGIDLLLEAFANLGKKFSNYKLIIAGPIIENDFYENLKNLIKQKRLSGKVIFSGEKTPKELAQAMNEAKLFVMPSRTEGYGVALAEALACGLRAVATNIGGLKEAGNSKDCIFVNPNSHELAKAIEKQLNRAK